MSFTHKKYKIPKKSYLSRFFGKWLKESRKKYPKFSTGKPRKANNNLMNAIQSIGGGNMSKNKKKDKKSKYEKQKKEKSNSKSKEEKMKSLRNILEKDADNKSIFTKAEKEEIKEIAREVYEEERSFSLIPDFLKKLPEKLQKQVMKWAMRA